MLRLYHIFEEEALTTPSKHQGDNTTPISKKKCNRTPRNILLSPTAWGNDVAEGKAALKSSDKAGLPQKSNSSSMGHGQNSAMTPRRNKMSTPTSKTAKSANAAASPSLRLMR